MNFAKETFWNFEEVKDMFLKKIVITLKYLQ